MDGFEKNLNLENVNFLVIDDSSFMRKVIKNILHNFVCGNVVEALLVLSKTRSSMQLFAIIRMVFFAGMFRIQARCIDARS